MVAWRPLWCVMLFFRGLLREFFSGGGGGRYIGWLRDTDVSYVFSCRSGERRERRKRRGSHRFAFLRLRLYGWFSFASMDSFIQRPGPFAFLHALTAMIHPQERDVCLTCHLSRVEVRVLCRPASQRLRLRQPLHQPFNRPSLPDASLGENATALLNSLTYFFPVDSPIPPFHPQRHFFAQLK